jgi:hypothetical protein
MQNDDVVTMRKPVSGLFLLDSADRNLTGATSFLTVESQPWNNFRITKPQPLVDGFAKNIAVTEIYFPWCIPNITPRNNTLYMTFVDNVVKTVTIPTGFYTGSLLAAEVQAAINALTAPFAGDPPYVSVLYNAADRVFTIRPNDGNTFTLYYSLNQTLDLLNYTQNPSLLKTMGFNPAQFGTEVLSPNGVTGSPTFIRYTNFVDIVSNRLHYDNEIKDGDSSQKTTRDVLCRVYCANEVSNYSVDEVGTAPFLIHRQFMTPKYIKLNPRQFFNAIDIQVYDQYGELVYTPPVNVTPALATQTYPDFVITMISSEQ